MPETTTAPATMDSAEAVKIMTREVREFVDFLIDTVGLGDSTPSNEVRNEFVRNHFEKDLSGYGIPVGEYFPGLSNGEVETIVNETLALPEYND